MTRSSRLKTALLLLLLTITACNKQKATIIPKLQINRRSAEMGTPIEMTYNFSTKKDYVASQKDYIVFCHFLDPKRIIRFQDDHRPPKPVTEWRPNGNYSYTRTLFIPRNIPAGEYTVAIGIFSPLRGDRLQLESNEFEPRAYNMGNLLVEIPPQEPTIQYADGWYDPESAPNDISLNWRWTKKQAVLKVRNPNSDALLYLKVDGVPERFNQPQQLTVSVNDHVIDTFPITSNQPVMKKYEVSKSVLGTAKMQEIKLQVDRTFTPAEDKVSKDTRELGVRVYQLYLGRAAD